MRNLFHTIYSIPKTCDIAYRIWKTTLEESHGLIHFSFDQWTSPNPLAFLGVVAHYLDDSHRNRITLIGLKRLRGSHSGENMAQLLIELLRDYELINKLRYFVIDNAPLNDTCLVKLLS